MWMPISSNGIYFLLLVFKVLYAVIQKFKVFPERLCIKEQVPPLVEYPGEPLLPSPLMCRVLEVFLIM